MPPTPYPPELIEAAEKEYPYPKKPELYPATRDEMMAIKSGIDAERQAFLKGLSLAMPLVEALEDLLYQYKSGLERDFKKIGTSVEWELENGNLPTYQKALDALANFPPNDIINSHKNKKQ